MAGRAMVFINQCYCQGYKTPQNKKLCTTLGDNHNTLTFETFKSSSNSSLLEQVWYQTVANKFSYKPIFIINYIIYQKSNDCPPYTSVDFLFVRCFSPVSQLTTLLTSIAVTMQKRIFVSQNSSIV